MATTEENNLSVHAEFLVYDCELTTSNSFDFLVRSLYKSYLKSMLSTNCKNQGFNYILILLTSKMLFN